MCNHFQEYVNVSSFGEMDKPSNKSIEDMIKIMMKRIIKSVDYEKFKYKGLEISLKLQFDDHEGNRMKRH